MKLSCSCSAVPTHDKLTGVIEEILKLANPGDLRSKIQNKKNQFRSRRYFSTNPTDDVVLLTRARRNDEKLPSRRFHAGTGLGPGPKAQAQSIAHTKYVHW